MKHSSIPPQLYKQIVQTVPVVSVDVVILSPNKSRALLGFRRNRPAKNTWYTIGGRLQKHETLEHAALRELQTELGLKISPRKLRFAGWMSEEFPDSSQGNFSTHNINFFFVLVGKTIPVVRDDQHSRVEWRSANDPQIHPFARKKIRLAQRLV